MDMGVHLLNLSIIKFNQENSCLKLTSLFRAKINLHVHTLIFMFQSPYFNVGMFGTNCITNLVDP